MFYKPLKIVKNGDVLVDMKIMPIFSKIHLFLPGDHLLLFGTNEIKSHFSAPKRAQVFLDGVLLGRIGASGTMDIKSDHFTGLLHAVYICA